MRLGRHMEGASVSSSGGGKIGQGNMAPTMYWAQIDSQPKSYTSQVKNDSIIKQYLFLQSSDVSVHWSCCALHLWTKHKHIIASKDNNIMFGMCLQVQQVASYEIP
mmetsp:Transcript_6824/g.11339  ORF Transcript_6824/g.11339 Transcript_6824/m.11339 type:complete len:106 (+) Transcript_6824:5676-5993(+)